MKKYRMPNGHIYLFKDDEVPFGATPLEVELKAVEPQNKAVKPANKKRKVVKTK